MTPTPIRVLCVDDHPLIREGIGYMLQQQADMCMVDTASCGKEALAKFDQLRPDVTIMDLRLPDMHGSEVIQRIRSKYPKARFLALTTFSSDVQALRTLRAGATSYLLKSALRTELLSAVRATFGGERHISQEVADNISANLVGDGLSEREVEVLQAVAAGCSNRTVASQLDVSEETVRAHLKSVFHKLGAKDRTQAVVIAIRRGYIPLWGTAKSHTADRRVRIVELTTKGRRLIEKGQVRHAADPDMALDPLTAAERVTLMKLLGRLTAVEDKDIT